MARKNKQPPVLAAAPDITPLAALGQWEGAERSHDRGWIYVPDIRSSTEVDSFSRGELMNRIAHLTRNEGLPRRIINCITRLVVGPGITPEPMTRDQVYNDNVRRLWTQRAESPVSFSLSEKFSASAAQRVLKRSQLRLGDSALVAARDESNRLRFALYGGNQIGDGAGRARDGFSDGIKLGPHNNALAYRFLGRTREGKETHADVPAQDVMFLAHLEEPDWNRGVTCLAHAVNKLKDRTEIRAALSKGIKMSSYQAWAVETQLGGASGAGNLGPGGSARPQVIVEDPKTAKPIALDKMLMSGEIQALKPGQTLKILHDQRPHPNVQAFEEEQIRDIALGTDWPFEVLWKIQALGGANTRFILVDAQSKAEEEQEEICAVFSRAYLLLLQEWERTGDLPPCADPEWYLHEWVTPARLSVDFGRDGRIYIDQWVRGHITLKTIFGSQGYRWKRETTQWLEEIAWQKMEMQRLGLTRADLPSAAGAAPQPPEDDTGAPARKPKPSAEPDADDEEDA